jgi:hypothetical protein
MAIYDKVVICILASIIIIASIIYAIKLRFYYIYSRDKSNYFGVVFERSESISEEEKVSLRRTQKSTTRIYMISYVFGTFMTIVGILLGCFLYYLIFKQ